MTTSIALNSVWTHLPDGPSFGWCAYAVVIAVGTQLRTLPPLYSPMVRLIDRDLVTTPISWFIGRYQLDSKSDSEYIL
jgi:hypothetical protein